MSSLPSGAQPAPHGMLFVASDVAPADEAEFNQWYDQEHVEERARIAGFLSAARYRACADGPRRYLGLYRTRDLAVFRSQAYQQAFAQQTPWSVRNLDRMQNPMRRVCAVQAVTGLGTGSQLAIVPLSSDAPAGDWSAPARAAGQQLQQMPGFVQSYLLQPDTALSTPLPRESTEGRQLFPMLVLESSRNQADLVQQAAALLHTDPSHAWLYALGWKLHSADLAG